MTAPNHDAMVEELTTKLADPAFKLAMEIYLGELLQEYLHLHREQIGKAVSWATEREENRVKTNITKRYLFDRLSEVRKSSKGYYITSNQQKLKSDDVWNESLWQRDADGHFARYIGTHPVLTQRNWQNVARENKGVLIHPTSDRRQVIQANLNMRSDVERNAAHSVYGLMNPSHQLPVDRTQREHAQDVNDKMSELTYALADATGDQSLRQRIQYVIHAPDGHVRVETPRAGIPPQVSFNTGERVEYMTPVGPDDPKTVAGQATNVAYIAGLNNDAAVKAGSVTHDVHRALNTTDWGTKVQATTNVLRVLSNNNQYANQANAIAQLMNILGPGGSRAFGNKLQQLSYRYLGQEAPEEFWGPAAKEGRQPDSKGNPEPIRTYELKLAHDLLPSIPSGEQYRLALEAGSTPPSRGYLLDRQGNVVNESVGYASDWFTPFDLRKLPKVRGGSYVRTRGYGGITPEDLRLAMRAGVNRVTVISNQGMFTLEFNPKAMHMGNRYGYAGNSLIRRYAKALDAIHGQQVKTADGVNLGEGPNMQLNADGYLAAMRDLQMRNPYFIRAEDDAHPFYRQMRDFGGTGLQDTTGPFAVDSGYMGPLDLYPKKARGGWSDNVAKDPLYQDQSGKFHYTTDARANLMHDRLLGAATKMRVSVDANGRPVNTNTRNQGSNNGRASWYNDANGIRRNSETGQAIDLQGRVISDQEGLAQRARLRANGRQDLTRPGPGQLDERRRESGIDYHQTHRPDSQMGQTQADPSYNSPAASAGAVSYTPAYTADPDEMHIDGNEALAATQDVRTLMQHFKRDNLIPRDVDNYDYLGEANRVLFPSGGGNPEGTKAYNDFVEKLRTSASFREGLYQELHETLGGHTLRGRVSVNPSEVFAALRGEDFDTQADKTPFDAPTEATDSGAVVTSAELNDNYDVANWLEDTKRLAEDNAQPEKLRKAREDLRDYKLYRNVVKQLDKARQNNPGRLPSVAQVARTEEELAAYNRLNDHMHGIIRHGYQMDYDAGIETQPDEEFTPNLGSHTPVPGGPFQSRRIAVNDVERGQSPDDIANDHFMGYYDEGKQGDDLRAALNDQAKKYEIFAAARRKGNKGDADQFDAVAAELRRLARENT